MVATPITGSPAHIDVTDPQLAVAAEDEIDDTVEAPGNDGESGS